MVLPASQSAPRVTMRKSPELLSYYILYYNKVCFLYTTRAFIFCSPVWLKLNEVLGLLLGIGLEVCCKAAFWV